MSTKFTPGPWEARAYPTAFSVCETTPSWRIGRTGHRIATIAIKPWSIHADEGAANARLIAAAPTMAAYIERRAAGGDAEAADIWEAINGSS